MLVINSRVKITIAFYWLIASFKNFFRAPLVYILLFILPAILFALYGALCYALYQLFMAPNDHNMNLMWLIFSIPVTLCIVVLLFAYLFRIPYIAKSVDELGKFSIGELFKGIFADRRMVAFAGCIIIFCILNCLANVGLVNYTKHALLPHAVFRLVEAIIAIITVAPIVFTPSICVLHHNVSVLQALKTSSIIFFRGTIGLNFILFIAIYFLLALLILNPLVFGIVGTFMANCIMHIANYYIVKTYTHRI